MSNSFIFLRVVSICNIRKNGIGEEVGGPLPNVQTTHWNAESSPYIVIQNIEVPANSKLKIDPGVAVQFNQFSLTVNGVIEARGTETAPIRFTSIENGKDPIRWKGIQFKPHSEPAVFDRNGMYQSGCILEHVIIENGEGVSIDRSAPFLHRCLVQNNRKREGGGIFSWYGSPVIDRCQVERNISQRDGGGIRTIQGSPIIRKSVIRFNVCQSGSGGGISSDFSTPQIISNTITHNSASKGGGIATGVPGIGRGYLSTAAHSRPTIVGNTLSHNWASTSGGGVHVVGSPLLSSNTISNNCISFGKTKTVAENIHTDKPSDRTTDRSNLGAGVYIENTLGGPAKILDNQFVHNQGARWGGGLHMRQASAEIKNNLFKHNQASFGGGGLSAVFGSEHQSPGSLQHGKVYQIEKNQFEGNLGGGIEFAGNGNQSAKLTNNSFKGNSSYGLINHSPRNVAAINCSFEASSRLAIQDQVFDYFDNQMFGKIQLSEREKPNTENGDAESTMFAPTSAPPMLPEISCQQPSKLEAHDSFWNSPQGQPIILTWQPCTSSQVGGYRVYFSKTRIGHSSPIGSDNQSRLGLSPIDVGNVNTVKLEGLDPGTTYLFSVTAYDNAEEESGFSQVISKTVPRKSSTDGS